MNPIVAGWKSSEFWGMLLHQAPTVVAVLLGASNPITLGVAAACGLGSVIYTHKRTLLKMKGIEVAEAVARAAAAAVEEAAGKQAE